MLCRFSYLFISTKKKNVFSLWLERMRLSPPPDGGTVQELFASSLRPPRAPNGRWSTIKLPFSIRMCTSSARISSARTALPLSRAVRLCVCGLLRACVCSKLNPSIPSPVNHHFDCHVCRHLVPREGRVVLRRTGPISPDPHSLRSIAFYCGAGIGAMIPIRPSFERGPNKLISCPFGNKKLNPKNNQQKKEEKSARRK